MQLGVGSFQHFEHALPPASSGGGPASGAHSSHSSPGGGGHPPAPLQQQNPQPPPGVLHIDHHQVLQHQPGQPRPGSYAPALARKGSVASDMSSSGEFEGEPFPGLGVGGARGQAGGLLLLQRDMAAILYMDVARSGQLIYDLIAILNQNAEHFDRSQAPEAQADGAREKLRQLADFISEEIPEVRKVAPSWPNLGLWLITKAFDCWIGHLT